MAPRQPKSAGRSLSGTLIDTLGFRPEGPLLPQMDPAMGRGYRIGQLRICPALAGVAPGIEPLLLANHAHPEVVTPFKAILGVLDEAGNDPGPMDGSFLRFLVRSSVENDRISRVVDVTTGNSQVIYVTGRSIRITVLNPQNFDLQAQMAMDEWQPGVSAWFTNQFFPGLAVETPIQAPPFCTQFKVYTPQGMAAPRLRGYAPGPILVVDQVLLVPNSDDIERIPGVDYTLAPTAPGSNHAINFQCFG